MRARFDENKHEKDMVKATLMLKAGEEEFWANQHPQPYLFPDSPGGTSYERYECYKVSGRLLYDICPLMQLVEVQMHQCPVFHLLTHFCISRFLNGVWITGTHQRKPCILITLLRESSGRSWGLRAGIERYVCSSQTDRRDASISEQAMKHDIKNLWMWAPIRPGPYAHAYPP